MSAVLKTRQEGLLCTELEGELVILDLESSTYLALNPTGTFLWTALAEGVNRGDLVDRLCDRFDLDRKTAGADVDAFVASLTERGLLQD